MSRRGNPYDNAKAESFMKTLKVEAVYLMAYETFEDVAADLPRFHRRGLQRSQAPLRAWIPEPGTVRGPTRPVDGSNPQPETVHPEGRTPVAVATSSAFRRVCATRAATIGFFYAMLQKDHATEYQLPVGGIAILPMA